MAIIKSLILTILLSLSNIVFASPAQDQTVDQFFQVTNLKKVTLDTLTDQELANIGKTKEEFWTLYAPEVRKIYKNMLTEEELLASIKFYQTPEGHSLLNKTPELIKLCIVASMKIALNTQVEGFNKLLQEE